MPFSRNNMTALDKFELLLSEQYKEPENGKHEDITAIILEEMGSDDSARVFI